MDLYFVYWLLNNVLHSAKIEIIFFILSCLCGI